MLSAYSVFLAGVTRAALVMAKNEVMVGREERQARQAREKFQLW